MRRLTALLVLWFAASVAAAAPIDDFFREFTDAWVRRNPDLAVRTQHFQGEEQDRLSRQLTPASRAWQLESIRIARQGLKRLGAFDAASLTPAQRESADVLRWQLQNIVDGEAFLDYDFPLQQMSGVNVGLPNEFTVVHPMARPRDAENYVARLRQVDRRMDEAIAESRRQARRGVLPPRFILDATIAQLRQFVEKPAAENPLVTEFSAKLARIEAVDVARRAELIGDATRIVEREVYPAWWRAIGALEQQRVKATDAAGLGRFAEGAGLYAQQLRRYTTTTLSAAQIHATGLGEVARIEAEMDALFRQLGYTSGSIGEREKQLSKDQSYPATDEGRRQIMADLNAYLADALRRTEGSFDIRPRTPVIAQPYPEFRWQSAAASYTPPPSDGSRPGIFQMPLRESYLTRFGLRTLVYHETVPGHHFQIALANENTGLPAFRRIRAFGGFAATTEGWALYAERFAAEDGWYEGDVPGRLGQLSDALFRARRLVVDTGLHAMGWTRQQAIDYGIEASEVERYVVMPGQACSYMIGQLQIVALRDRARAALGERFSNRAFHNVVLALGAVPLPMVEAAVDAYIAREGGAAGRAN